MRFRKKPVVIDAEQFKGDYSVIDEWLSSLGVDVGPEHGTETWQMPGDERLIIATLEGDMAAEVGDWIIRGVKGELYPCKPDIFEATYDRVDEAP